MNLFIYSLIIPLRGGSALTSYTRVLLHQTASFVNESRPADRTFAACRAAPLAVIKPPNLDSEKLPPKGNE